FAEPETFALERSSPISRVPSNSPKEPRTVAMPRCLTEKPIVEWAGSAVQVPVAMGVVAVVMCCSLRLVALTNLLAQLYTKMLARASDRSTGSGSDPRGPSFRSAGRLATARGPDQLSGSLPVRAFEQRAGLSTRPRFRAASRRARSADHAWSRPC